MGRIVKLSQISKLITPNTATLVGGSFDLFHIGHLRYLRAASKRGRPLVVIVQTDEGVRIRKGQNRPIINENQRAEIIAALGFVDYVLILDKPSHYNGYLELIKPRHLVFFSENLVYRKRRAVDIEKKYPSIKVVFIKPSEVGKKVMSTTRIAHKILNGQVIGKVKDKIAKELLEIQKGSKAKVGKISALLVKNGKIIERAGNTKSEYHAERLLFKHARAKKLDLRNYRLYILIPPCIMCAEEILKSPIKEVFYLHPYGNDDGLKLLRSRGIRVKRMAGV